MTTQPKYRKFNSVQRKQIADTIRAYKSSGGNMKPMFIAEMLNSKGIAHCNGHWNGSKVSQFLIITPVRSRGHIQVMEKSPQVQLAPVANPGRSDLIQVAEIILALNLDNSKKEMILRQLLKEEK